ncbi:carboxylesterase family protein [Erythrobacter litoralis HTCC2594]|uniref:Carboxylesterase family protein n=1 Tax=Erythrobacter litoralis (strain HTCC2594) TaxID=314225 RepID=Q2N6S3_ERYLH|nr:carboxylesterase family protein [Erythrobacter litoralis HTCC2594]
MGRERNSGVGWLSWTLIALVALALVGAGLWWWALSAQSVATLDRVDALFTGSKVEQSAPIPFGTELEQAVVVATPLAPSAELRPVVLFVHGGSWNRGSAVDYAFVARNLAIEGYVGVSAGYRLVPGGEFPAMVEDAARALRWTVDHIADYGGDPDRIYLMGHSAGAYNVAMLALDAQWLEHEDLPMDAIKGVIGLAGPYDFLPLDSDSTSNAFGGASDLAATQPINFARSDAPPMLLLTGYADTTVRPRNSRALAAALTREGQSTEPVLLPGLTHSGIIMALSRPFEGNGAVKAAIFGFLAAREHGDRATPSSPIQAAGG